MSVIRTGRRDRPGIVFDLEDGDGFLDWLQTELRVRRMSQRQLAARAGVDHSSVSRLLRGGRVPSLRTAMRIAQSVDPDSARTVDRAPLAERLARAVARVEYALRADPGLGEADVQEIMYRYLAIRRGHASRRKTRKPEQLNGGRHLPATAEGRGRTSAGPEAAGPEAAGPGAARSGSARPEASAAPPNRGVRR